MPPTSKIDGLAVSFTKWIGSISSVIVHTILFIASFFAVALGVELDTVLLVLTTVVSLEAIYLAIFIQMSVNRQSETIQEVEENIDEIQGDVDEIQGDIDEIQEDVVGISADIDEIQEDVEEVAADSTETTINKIHDDLKRLVEDIEKLKSQSKPE
jgi:peptidoglycan hydrolase CwlO-like protein